jgi:hypothetical protein
MKTFVGSGRTAPLVFNLGDPSVSFTLRSLYPPGEKASGTHWTGGYVGPRTGPESVTRKLIAPIRNRSPVVQPISLVSILTPSLLLGLWSLFVSNDISKRKILTPILLTVTYRLADIIVFHTWSSLRLNFHYKLLRIIRNPKISRHFWHNFVPLSIHDVGQGPLKEMKFAGLCVCVSRRHAQSGFVLLSNNETQGGEMHVTLPVGLLLWKTFWY